jgi:CheY-like chemotaxis protein
MFCTGTIMRKYQETIAVMETKMIAIFEDDRVNRFIYERLFRSRKDVQLYVFDSAEKGLSMAARIPFDVIFIEVHFWENFGGFSILDKLKRICMPGTPFIAMTSLLQQNDLEYILQAGFSMCLEKPVVFSAMDFYV